MKSFLKYLLVLLSGFIIIIIILLFFILSLAPSEPIIENNSYLSLTLNGSFPEYIAPSELDELTGELRLDLKKVRDNLEKAAIDERINGVILNLGFIQIGYAKINEIHSYINNYKKSGKKIYAYMDFGLTKEYLIATACDSIFMSENANLFLTGIGANVNFYKGLLDKIGVQADFVHVGNYKNAPDMYTRDSMSGFQKEVLNKILDQIYDNILQTIANKRNINIERVTYLINNKTGFTGKEALENGLIDGNLYKDAIPNLFNFKDESPSMISGEVYSAVPASSLKLRTKSKIAVIDISGTISSGDGSDDILVGKLAGSNSIVEDINHAANSKSIKAIILRIDSPGGSATASDYIWKAAKAAAGKKPVIASISDYGASGGYYIALAADTIIANPASLVGSIGVFAGKFSLEEFYKKIGLRNVSLKRGEHAGLFSIDRLWNKSERKIIQNLIEEFYKNFVSKVVESRNLNYQQADNVSQGRVWTGSQGRINGLVDSVGTFYDAEKLVKKMAGINANESVRLIHYPRKKNLFTELFNIIYSYSQSIELILETKIEFFRENQNQPLTLMPFIIEWN